MGNWAVLKVICLLLNLTTLAAPNDSCYGRCVCEDEAVHCALLDFSQTRLRVPQNTLALTLTSTQGAISNGYFEEYTRLKTIRILSGTNISLQDGCFRGLFSVEELRIENTNLNIVPPVSLALLPRLEMLSLANNQIENLTAGHFAYNTRLRVLNLSNNPISTIAPNLFTGLERLIHLDFHDCSLRSFDVNDIIHLVHLQYINLSMNRIEKIAGVQRNPRGKTPNHMVGLFRNLTFVDLSGNRINEMPFIGSAVEHLNLDNNAFTVANRTFLQLPNKLRVLQMSNNENLSHVSRNFLKQCPLISSVNISHNQRLVNIEHSAFDGLPNLVKVDISSNSLLHLPRSLNSLEPTSLVLDNNDFECDCGFIAFWKSRTNRTANITCSMESSTVSLKEAIYHILCEPLKVTVHERYAWTPFNATAILSCKTSGHPQPSITWITPQRYVFHWTPPDSRKMEHHLSRHTSQLTQHAELDHYRVLSDGRLHVAAAAPRHQGLYVCIAENSVEKLSDSVFLTVGVASLHDIKIMALLMALAACLTAIAIALSVRIGMFIFYQCGCCTCCSDEPPPKIKRLKEILESIEQWRAQQLEGLRDNYNQQVAGIKDSCYQQVERIRETYRGQARYLGDMREYGAQQIGEFREQYLDQVRKVRDYSLCRMNRVHENYIFQRNRIRKYSSHQLVRLRESARYQQKTLNRLMETLPDLYLQNCRTGSCHRTDSEFFPWDACSTDFDSEWSPEEALAPEGSGHRAVLECTSRPLASMSTAVIIETTLAPDSGPAESQAADDNTAPDSGPAESQAADNNTATAQCESPLIEVVCIDSNDDEVAVENNADNAPLNRAPANKTDAVENTTCEPDSEHATPPPLSDNDGATAVRLVIFNELDQQIEQTDL